MDSYTHETKSTVPLAGHNLRFSLNVSSTSASSSSSVSASAKPKSPVDFELLLKPKDENIERLCVHMTPTTLDMFVNRLATVVNRNKK